MSALIHSHIKCSGLFLLCGCVALAAPPGYKVLQVTDTPDTYEHEARINDVGDIVFARGIYEYGRDSTDICLYRNGVLTQITDDVELVSDSLPDINNHRTVVWGRAIGPEGPWGLTREIAMWRDGAIEILTDNALYDIGPEINDNGEIVWSQTTAVGCKNSPIEGIRLWRNGEIIDLYDDGSHNAVPTMSNEGTIAWTNYRWCGKGWTSEIVALNNGEITQLSKGPTAQVSRMSPSGKLVAWHNYNHVIEIWDSGVITTIENPGIASIPFINSRGYCVFTVLNEDTGAGDAWLYIDGEMRLLASDNVDWLVNDINEWGDIAIRHGNWGETDTDIFLYQRLPYGDMNCDGKVTFEDIDGFTLALIDRAEYEAAYPDCDWWLADTSGDRKIDFDDIGPFVECIIEGCER
jgi:hypothetical protein